MNVQSLVGLVSGWAADFRRSMMSERVEYERGSLSRIIAVSPYSVSPSRAMIDGFTMFGNTEIFVAFVRDFSTHENGFDPPKRGDTITKTTPSGEAVYVVSDEGNPAWQYAPEDSGRNTILIHTRRKPI